VAGALRSAPFAGLAKPNKSKQVYLVFFFVCVKASLPSSQCPTEKENADLLTERKKERKKKLIQYPDNVVSRPFSHIFGEYGIIRMAGRRHSVEK
jgi:hypothetical protein